MGAIPVTNISDRTQMWGAYTLEPSETVDLPYDLARTLAQMPEYKCDSVELLGEYKFLSESGTYLGWSSPFDYRDGYGSVGIDIAATFLKMGVGLSIYPRDYDPSDVRFGAIPLEKWAEDAHIPESIVDQLSSDQENCFYGINLTFPRDVAKHPFPRGIGYTMFETTLPPRDWADGMNKARRVIVPCKQNVQAFRDIGVTVPISVVGLGVDPDRWTRFDHKPDPFGGFTFLMSGGITHRKNPMGAARAFVDAFDRRQYPDVRLIIKTRANHCAASFSDWANYCPKDERVQIVCEDSTPSRMVRWMHEADAFVFPSFAEGFGLPPLQAMSTGLPVIVSDNSGMSEYCDSRYNYPIPCEEVKVPDAAHGGYPDAWGDVGNWWNPDHDALVETMRKVYFEQEQAFAKGVAAAKWIRIAWTWEHTCKKLLEVVMNDAKGDGLL